MVTVKELLTSMIEKINSRIRSINGVTVMINNFDIIKR